MTTAIEYSHSFKCRIKQILSSRKWLKYECTALSVISVHYATSLWCLIGKHEKSQLLSPLQHRHLIFVTKCQGFHYSCIAMPTVKIIWGKICSEQCSYCSSFLSSAGGFIVACAQTAGILAATSLLQYCLCKSFAPLLLITRPRTLVFLDFQAHGEIGCWCTSKSASRD